MNLQRGRIDGTPGFPFILQLCRSRLIHRTTCHQHDGLWRREAKSCGVYHVRLRIVCGLPFLFSLGVSAGCGVGSDCFLSSRVSQRSVLCVCRGCQVYTGSPPPCKHCSSSASLASVLELKVLGPFMVSLFSLSAIICYLFIVGSPLVSL